MSDNTATPRARFTLSEDWIATLIGLALVLIVGSGLFGPGPQSEKVSAEAAETTLTEVKAVDSWSLNAKMGDTKLPIRRPVSNLADGQRVIYTCTDNVLERSEAASLPPGEYPDPASGHAQVAVINTCPAAVTLTLKTDYAVRWPAFGLFD